MSSPRGGEAFLVGPAAGASPLLETLGSTLAIGRRFLLSAVRDLDADTLAASPGQARNGIGSLLAHVAAAERMFQLITGEGRNFGPGEEDLAHAFRFEADPLHGQGLEAYLAQLAAVREGTRLLFEAKDDAWLAQERSFFGRPSNVHYYWTHWLLDEARHAGQIILLRKYLLPGADADFGPYAGL